MSVGRVQGLVTPAITHQTVPQQGKLGRFADRVVNWFQSKATPEAYMARRFAEANSILRGLGTDPMYGPHLANMAAGTLNGAAATTRPWSEIIAGVVHNLDGQVRLNRGLNQMTALQFSESTNLGGVNFGSLFADTAVKAGLPLDTGLYGLKGLQADIRQAILDAGAGGTKHVSTAEAREIARQKIEVFLESKAHLFEALDETPGLLPTDVTALKEQVLREPHWGSGEYGLVRLVNTYHFQTQVEPQMNRLLSEAIDRHGLTDVIGQLNTSKVVYNVERFTISQHETLLSPEQALQLAERTFDRFCQQKADVLGHIDTLAVPEPAKQVLRSCTLENTNIKSAAYLDEMVSLMGNVDQLAQDLTGAQNDGQFVRALEKFSSAFFNTMGRAGGQNADKDEMLDFSLGAMRAWIATQSPQNQQLVLDALTSPRGEKVVGGMTAMALVVGTPRGAGSMQSITRCTDNALGLASELCRSLGQPETRLDALANAFDRIQTVDDLPPSVYEFGVRNRVDLAPRKVIGQTAADQFTEAFRAEYELGLNTEFGKPETYNNGLSNTLKADMGRAQFRFGLNQVPYGDAQRDELAFHQFFGGDTAGKEAVSRVMHQGLMGPIRVHLAGNQSGPFQGDLAFATGGSRLHHEVDVLPDGGYRVTATFRSQPNGIVLPDGTYQELDPLKSHYNVRISFEIPRASIDQGTPRATVTGVTYDLTLDK